MTKYNDRYQEEPGAAIDLAINELREKLLSTDVDTMRAAIATLEDTAVDGGLPRDTWRLEKVKYQVQRRIERAEAGEDILAGDREDRANFLVSFIGTENNPGELPLALERIEQAMKRGWSYERSVKRWGIRGHPHFAVFFPVTKYWGDARWVRKKVGLPVDE